MSVVLNCVVFQSLSGYILCCVCGFILCSDSNFILCDECGYRVCSDCASIMFLFFSYIF